MTATAHHGPAITWAARYAFCDSIWRGRARLIIDAELEAVLRATVEDEDGFDAPWRGLLESLVPRERSVATWMVVGSEQTARLLAPYFAGVRFVPADALDDRFARLQWETALVTLDLHDDDHGLSPGRLGVTSHTAESVLVDVAAACGPGRIAVVSARGPQLGYEEFVEMLRPTFGEARIYGGYAPGMFAFAEFAMDGDDAIAGEFEMTDDDPETFRVERDGDGHQGGGQPTARQAEDGRWDDGDALDEDEEDDGVPLSFDNTLGPAVPEYTVWIGIIGSASEFGEGLTLIELPPASDTSSDGYDGDAARGPHGDDDGHGALRLQLQETRKVAELGALERQRLVERIDMAQAENAGLRSAVGQLREQLASALDPALGGERLDAALAREQSLRWRVAALEREVAELRVRPVDDVTAELETLRARLEAADTAEPGARRNGAVIESVSLESTAHPRTPGNPDAARRLGARRPGSGRQAALRVIEGLVRRIDRGGVERASLRRELTALRRRLRG